MIKKLRKKLLLHKKRRAEQNGKQILERKDEARNKREKQIM